MSKIQEFKETYERFMKALKYIVENETKLKQDNSKWERIKKNFSEKFEKPLDESWQALSKDEKKSLSSVYLHRKAQADPVVKALMEKFNAKIVSVKEGENAADSD